MSVDTQTGLFVKVVESGWWYVPVKNNKTTTSSGIMPLNYPHANFTSSLELLGRPPGLQGVYHYA